MKTAALRFLYQQRRLLRVSMCLFMLLIKIREIQHSQNYMKSLLQDKFGLLNVCD